MAGARSATRAYKLAALSTYEGRTPLLPPPLAGEGRAGEGGRAELSGERLRREFERRDPPPQPSPAVQTRRQR